MSSVPWGDLRDADQMTVTAIGSVGYDMDAVQLADPVALAVVWGVV